MTNPIEESEMTRPLLLAFVFLALATPAAQAGSMSDGHWTPTGCGSEPQPVGLDLSSIEAYNRSIPAAKAWQQQANAYVSCLIGEANADNGAIVKAVNEAQGRIKSQFDRINAEGSSASSRFGGKKEPSETTAAPADAAPAR